MTIHYDSLLSVSDRVRRGELSSVEVTAGLLERIARYDGRLHSALMVLGGVTCLVSTIFGYVAIRHYREQIAAPQEK